VPLDYAWSERPLHEAILELVETRRAPIYLVGFTQRECVEQAQALTSLVVVDKERRRDLAEALAGVRFDTAAGKELRRFLGHGIGVHHAGMLPRYRLVVEKLAQQGLLQVVCGTDTLGVGVNIPIRTVLFSRLCKFDGRTTALVRVRDFQQIAGRAGRRGFDDRGSVVVQAPEHVVENQRLLRKAGDDPKARRKVVLRKPPERGFVPWDEKTLERLASSPPEALVSRFQLRHAHVLEVLARELAHGRRDGGYRRLLALIDRSLESPGRRSRHRRELAQLFRSLLAAGIVELVRVPWARGPAVRVAPHLQKDFSLLQALSLYLFELLGVLDPSGPDYALDVVSLVEAITEGPEVILRAQLSRLRSDELARLRAQGAEYEEREAALDRLAAPAPLADLVETTFEVFRRAHPWVRGEDVRPKSIARDLYERCLTFNQYVGYYGIARSEGVLLRYLGQVYKSLAQTVPAASRTEAVQDVIAYFRTLLAGVDSSLLQEWEGLRAPAPESLADVPAAPPLEPQVRGLLHRVVQALAAGDVDEAAAQLPLSLGEGGVDELAGRLGRALADCLAELGTLRSGHAARYHRLTRLEPDGQGRTIASQVLVGDEGESDWVLEVEVACDEAGVPRLGFVALRA
jgi:hypothetical protein